MRQKDREKFVKLANGRVNRALKAIQLIGNLSNRSNYDYTEGDVEKIFQAMQAELRSCRTRFQQNGRPGQEEFRLE